MVPWANKVYKQTPECQRLLYQTERMRKVKARWLYIVEAGKIGDDTLFILLFCLSPSPSRTIAHSSRQPRLY